MKHRFRILLVGFILFLTWYRILPTTFIGEGFYYFTNGFFNRGDYFGVDIGGRLLFDLFRNVFRDTILYYNLILLAVIISLGIMLYFLVFKSTKNYAAAVIAAILFGTNYEPLYEYLAIGGYHHFVQRVMFFLFLFPSFMLFEKYLRTKKIIYGFPSLVLYTGSIYLGEFHIYFIVFYVTYFLGFYILKRKFSLDDVKVFLFSTFYPISTAFLLYLDSHVGGVGYIRDKNFLEFLIVKRIEVFDLVFRQLTVLSLPSQITVSIIKNFHLSYDQGVRYFYLPLIFIYVFAFIYIVKKNKAMFPITFCSLLFIPIVFLINIFLREEYMLNLTQGTRYMFVPSIGYSIFWGIFFSTLLKNLEMSIYRTIGIILLSGWVVMNIVKLNSKIEEYKPRFEAIKKSIEYIKFHSKKLRDDSIVIAPSVLEFNGADFCQIFYGKKTMFFTIYVVDWTNQIKRPIDPRKDLVLDYNYGAKMVDDLTDKYDEIVERRRTEHRQ